MAGTRKWSTCKHGHPITDENSYMRQGSDGYWFRRCRICRRAENAKYQAARKEPEGQKRAWSGVQKAVDKGHIVKQPCVVCGAPDVHAHHPNGYIGAAKFDIEWLCPKHHSAAHKAKAA